MWLVPALHCSARLRKDHDAHHRPASGRRLGAGCVPAPTSSCTILAHQGTGCARPGLRRAGLQPCRDGLLQAHGPSWPRCRTHPQWTSEQDRPPHRSDHASFVTDAGYERECGESALVWMSVVGRRFRHSQCWNLCENPYPGWNEVHCIRLQDL